MNYIERVDYNKVITIKLVIPNSCNAKCPFCYNKDKNITLNKEEFYNNFIDELDYVLKEIGDKNPVSIDITGGEPTLDYEFLIRVLNRLKEYNIKSKVLRTTMTTNGTNLIKVIPYLKGVIDYVNISIHDYRIEERMNILGLSIPSSYYKSCVSQLKEIGITTSVCAVIFKEIPDFKSWMDNFIDWAKENGFISVRFRCNVFWDKSSIFDKYLLQEKEDDDFTVITYENTTDSHWLRLRRKSDKMRVFFLHGVLDTSILTKGIEYVIDTNGKCYCDYYRKTPIRDYKYEIGKIYDLVKD